MEIDLDKVDGKLFMSPFGEQFAFNMQMYEYRKRRVLDIDTTIKENQMEFLMAFDAFIALFRALFLESFKNCYTAQNYFVALGRDDIAKRIDDFLDSPFNEYSNLTIRRVLKFLADKFVCHLDPITSEELGWANAHMATLKNPYTRVNLQYICDELDKIMNEIMCAAWKDSLHRYNKISNVIIVFMLFIISFLLLLACGTHFWRTNNASVYIPLFMNVACICFSLMAMWFASSFNIKCKVFDYIGRNSYCFFIAHLVLVPLADITPGIKSALLYVCIVLLGSFALAEAYNRLTSVLGIDRNHK